MSHPRRSLEEFIAAFWRRVDRGRPDECWFWSGAVSERTGYPMARARDGRVTTAGQVLLFDVLGIPPGPQALHHCDTPLCLNPAHLWPGTAFDNMRDAAAKGRLAQQRRRAERLALAAARA